MSVASAKFHVVTKCLCQQKAIYFRQTSVATPAGRRTQASEQSELVSEQVLLAMQKRYNEFRTLYQSLHTNSGMDIDFPKKKITGNKDRDFIVMRQNALQQFLNMVTNNFILRHSMALKQFLHPSLYTGNLSGIVQLCNKQSSI